MLYAGFVLSLVCIASINRVNVFCYDMHNLIDVN